jgi:peptidoglycan/xylan/chitin deacetylase (PgdA/CDA1 family)
LLASPLGASAAPPPANRQPIPDKLIVLTFDDSNNSDITTVAPILQRYGFGATFYVTRGLGADKDHEHFLTWDEVQQLDERGFEIGNHTKSHAGVKGLSKAELREELRFIQRECQQRGITVPVTFCYPGFGHAVHAVHVLRDEGFLFARRGVGPEYPDGGQGSRGPAYDPNVDHPLLIPTTGYAGPEWGMEDLEWAVAQARDGKITVLVFHGVPGPLHPWVHTNPQDFEKYMQYLQDEGCHVIALRDLVKYVDPQAGPADPYEPIRRRVAEGNRP